jgi:MoaA/NifB/PqqE/SkfB family radical SAM enzyme
MEQDKVAVAFDVICREVEAAIKELNDEGARAFQTSRYDDVEKLRQVAEELGVFHYNVRQLHNHWIAKFASADLSPPAQEEPQESSTGALRPPEVAKEGTGLLNRLGQA